MTPPSSTHRTAPLTSRARLRIARRDGPRDTAPAHIEEFDVDVRSDTTVSDALAAIERHPVTVAGTEVPPVAWETGCLQGVCGACTVLVNGVVRMACTTRLAEAARGRRAVTLAALTRFPVVRDLVVDRSRLFRDLQRAEVWVSAGPMDAGELPPESPERARALQPAAACITCGACLEACPEYGETRLFVGAAVLAQVERLGEHAVGTVDHAKRLETMTGAGGVSDCGKSENCLSVCPAGIPLPTAIRKLSRDASRRSLPGFPRG